MDLHSHFTIQHPEYRFRPEMDFEDYFNQDISHDKIQYAKHYLEHHMGITLEENLYIDFSAIGVKLFGCLLVDLLVNYEIYKEEQLDG